MPDIRSLFDELVEQNGRFSATVWAKRPFVILLNHSALGAKRPFSPLSSSPLPQTLPTQHPTIRQEAVWKRFGSAWRG
ncbi:MAG: hypothetical protein KC423_08775 [Anaerolineales bacterium]|nr:hypothetical protein [Anaerolineales bacterium]